MTMEAKVLAAISRLDEKIDNIKADVERISSTLDGNGSIGIRTRVDRLERDAQRSNENKKSKWGLFSGIIISLTTIFVSLGGTALFIIFN